MSARRSAGAVFHRCVRTARISELTGSGEKLTQLLDRFVERDQALTRRKADVQRELEKTRRAILDVTAEAGQVDERLATLPRLEETLQRYRESGLEERRNPRRFLPQSGVRAVCYRGTEPDYATRADEILTAPLTPLGVPDGSPVEPGLVDQTWDFVRRNTTPAAHLEGARRVDRWEYPEDVIREAVVNALVHRDYGVAGTDVMLCIFADRLEITSPGRLPNTVTPEGMKTGMRYARNQTLVNVMRDYGYVDARGMGVRNKIIPGMRAHNGTEPDLGRRGAPLHGPVVEGASHGDRNGIRLRGHFPAHLARKRTPDQSASLPGHRGQRPNGVALRPE